MINNKCCPLCAKTTTEPYCPSCARMKIQVRTLTVIELRARLMQTRGGSNMVRSAIMALTGGRV
jgi:hypothetical protein